jgi:hypothetical protein
MMFLPMIDGRLVMGMGMGDTTWSYLPLTFGVEEVPTKKWSSREIILCNHFYSYMLLFDGAMMTYTQIQHTIKPYLYGLPFSIA